MNFGGGNEGSDAPAALDNPFAFEGSESVAGGHEADLMNLGEVALGGNGVPGMQMPGIDTLANGALNSLVGRQAVAVLRWHSLSRINPGAPRAAWTHDKDDNPFHAQVKALECRALVP